MKKEIKFFIPKIFLLAMLRALHINLKKVLINKNNIIIG